ncbi:hypothetical protein K492DRAFT_181072 [Lichtheimia hyalospora FSU 10163]|nr:hypothetical protein K492DRAFT_181072 [Lichtheimia hyalospora FSU 10163]
MTLIVPNPTHSHTRHVNTNAIVSWLNHEDNASHRHRQSHHIFNTDAYIPLPLTKYCLSLLTHAQEEILIQSHVAEHNLIQHEYDSSCKIAPFMAMTYHFTSSNSE